MLLGRPADPVFFGEIDRLLCEATTAQSAAIDDPKVVMSDLAGRGYQLGLITNDAEATARAHVRKLGIDHILAFVAGYNSGFGAKPAPGRNIAFAAAVGVPTTEIVMVGDTALDIATARKARARAVGVLTDRTHPILCNLPAGCRHRVDCAAFRMARNHNDRHWLVPEIRYRAPLK